MFLDPSWTVLAGIVFPKSADSVTKIRMAGLDGPHLLKIKETPSSFPLY